jgi:hypothetical protein
MGEGEVMSLYEGKIDTLPYQTFQKLKQKFPVKTILVSEYDLTQQGLGMYFKDHREYVRHLFAKEGVEILRFGHNYKSLDTSHPELGLVFLANDSVIVPGLEIHALIGHNAKYMAEAAKAIDGL